MSNSSTMAKIFEQLASFFEEKESENFKPQWNIVIGQRGWVWVGLVTMHGRYFHIEHAHCIRQWGTTTGLGQLAKGPTSDTVLDACPLIKCHELTVVARYDVDEVPWKERLMKDS